MLKGVEGGFAQAGHGRKDFMSKPSKDDWVVFYSSKDKFENGKHYKNLLLLDKLLMKNLINQIQTTISILTGEMLNLRIIRKLKFVLYLNDLLLSRIRKSGAFISLAVFVKFKKKILR